MANKEYTYTVNGIDSTEYYYWNDNHTWTYPYTTTQSWTYSYPIYMYQVFCPKPRCKGIFWGQLETTAICPKCESRVKITKEPAPDYEVQVS